MALRYFSGNDWKSTVLCVDPKSVEAKPDGELLDTIDGDQEIIRVKAVPYQWTRMFGFGGIGWRAYGAIDQAAQRLFRERRFDAVYFSSTVFRTFCLGPVWAKKFGVPYFIDYHDPWWTDYYFKPGAPLPPGGMAKYRIIQWLARKNEGRVIRGATGVTCVSAAYVKMLRERYPEVDSPKFIELPFGAPETDFEIIRKKRNVLAKSDRRPKECWSYIGAGGPIMARSVAIFAETLKTAISKGVVDSQKMRIDMAGTSYATYGKPVATLWPILHRAIPDLEGGESVERLAYLDTLGRLMGSDRLMLFGTDDPGYTASKLFTYVLARRPLLVICREESSVARIVRETKSAELITFGEGDLGLRIEDRGKVKPEWREAMGRWLAMDPAKEPPTDWKAFEPYTARKMTEKLCRFFDERLADEKRKTGKMGDRSPSTLGAGPLCGGRWEIGEAVGKTGLRIGPRRPAPAHPIQSLREFMEIRLRGGIEDRGLRGKGVRSEDRGWRGRSRKFQSASILNAQSSALPRVLLVHPGVQHAPRLAEALEKQGVLTRFWTGWGKATESQNGNGKRSIGIPTAKLKTRPWLEWMALAMSKSGIDPEKVWHWRNRIFQNLIPDAEIAQADVVIGFDTGSWILARKAKETGKKFILDQSIGHPEARIPEMAKMGRAEETWIEPYQPRPGRLANWEKVEHELADRIVVASRFTKNTLIGQGVPPEKIRILPYGVGKEFLGAGERRDGTSKCGKIRFLYLGQLTQRKGIQLLLEAWKGLPVDQAELVLMGGGTTRGWKRVAGEGVVFRGQAGRKEVLEMMGRSDVLILPSLFEGFGLVILEAMAAGLPVITTQNTGGPDVIEEEKEGFIVPAGNSEALREKMLYFIQNPGKAAEMGQAAHQKAREYTWEKYGRAYAEIVREVV